MNPIDHERFEDDAGAYLLGALDEPESRAFEDHLERCASCRVEVDRLRLASDALPRSVEPFAPPESLKRDLMRTVAAEAAASPGGALARSPARRSLRERLGLDRLVRGMRVEVAWASAAFLLIVGTVLGYSITQLSDNGDGGGQRMVSASVDHSRLRQASATLILPKDERGGAQLRVSGMPPPRPGQVYEVWLKRGDQVVPSSLFGVAHDGQGVAGIADDLGGVSAVLVTRERTGGARVPSERAVISARV